MVDTGTLSNGTADAVDSPALPDVVVVSLAEMQRFPSPGTQRALRAQIGKDYMALVGPDADSADRTQTQIWTHLRKTIPNLRWEDCDEISMEVPDADAAVVDPTRLSVAVSSQPSVGSGG